MASFLIQGFNQQTPANRAIVASAYGRRSASSGRRKRRSKRSASTASRGKSKTRSRASTRTARKSRSSRPARLVKGSAAAKAYMAKIRRKRK